MKYVEFGKGNALSPESQATIEFVDATARSLTWKATLGGIRTTIYGGDSGMAAPGDCEIIVATADRISRLPPTILEDPSLQLAVVVHSPSKLQLDVPTSIEFLVMGVRRPDCAPQSSWTVPDCSSYLVEWSSRRL